MGFKTTIVLIRHGMTQGNKEKRYIGITDEPLLEESVAALTKKRDEVAASVRYRRQTKCYVSPLLRCRQTAAAIFPELEQVVIENFKECNFGLFENKNYEELNGNPVYQQFIDSNGQTAFPEGEDQQCFCKRVNDAFEALVHAFLKEQERLQNRPSNVETMDPLCIVAHGGTIMSILSKYATDRKPFYEWMLGNGCYYKGALYFDDKTGRITIEKIGKRTCLM